MRTLVLPLLLGTACASSPPPRPAAPSSPAHEHRGLHRAEPDGYRAHHANHDFDNAEDWARRFEDPARDAWQQPERVLEILALGPSMRVADIGSATGYFPVRLAPRVPDGRVWGVDVEPDMVRYLNERARREGHDNLFSIRGDERDPLLPEAVDRVLTVNTVHHIADRPAYFRRVAQHLRPGGRVVIVDFRIGDLPVGPPDAAKIAPDAMVKDMVAAGLALVSRHDDLLPHQWILVFARAETPEH